MAFFGWSSDVPAGWCEAAWDEAVRQSAADNIAAENVLNCFLKRCMAVRVCYRL